MAGRLADEPVRDLFTRFCREIALFSDSMTVVVTPFEVRYSDPQGFQVHVSPYRDLFRVSINPANPCDIRVSGEDGYVSALDLALKSFLDIHALAAGGAEPDPGNGSTTAPSMFRP